MRSIDERVVEMQFDNRQFESGVSTSLSTIDRLKNALNFENSTNGLDSIGKAANNLSTQFESGRMVSAIETISDRFSTMGIIGMTVLQDLTRTALNFAEQFVTAIPRKIASGGWSRAMNIETAKFQIEGLGTAWKTVEGDIDYGVSGTAYGLDAAATVASQLMQSGIEIGGVYEGANQHISEMGKALLAVSGVAGMTSRSYEEIGDLFTSVAGQGRVTGDTLSRMGMKGLNAAADLAKFFNGVNSGAYEASESVTAAIKKITNGADVTETQVRDFVTKKLVDSNMFYESMWQLYGEHAKDANNTLTGILSNINAAFSKIGADFATPFIQNAIKPLQEVRLIINEVRKQLGYISSTESKGILKVWQQLAPIISNTAVEMIKGIDLSWMSTFFEGILNLIFDIALIIKPIQEAFVDIFPPATGEQMQSLAKGFRNLTEKFMISREAADNLKRTFRGVFAAFGIVGDAIKAVINAVLPAGSIFKDLGGGILDTTASIGDYIVNLRQIIKDSNFFETAISKVKDGINAFASAIHGGFGPAIDAIKSAFEKIKSFIGQKINLDIFGNFGTEAEGKVNPIKSAFEVLANVVNFLFSKLSNAVPSILSLLEKLWQGVKTAFFMLKETLLGGDLGQAVKNTTFAAVLYNLKNAFLQLRKLFENFSKGGSMGSAIKAVLSDTSTALQQLGKSLNANYFLKLGAALLMLAFAIDKISKIDGAALGQSTLAISVLMGELVGSMELLTKFGGSSSLGKVGTTMLAMSVSILILASAMKKLADIPFDNLVQGLFAVTVLVTELTVVSLILGNLGGKIPKGASALIIMAIAVRILAGAIKTLADIPFDGLMHGLLAVTVLLGELTAVALLLGNLGGRIKGGMVGLIAMAASILILTKAVEKLGALQPEQMAQGLKGVTVLLLELAALMVAAKFGKMNISMGIGLIALAAALLILSKAVGIFGKMDIDAMKQGIAAVGALLGIIAIFSILAGMAKHILASAVSLVIVGAALKIISGVVERLGSMDTGKVIQGLVAMGAILVEVGIFAIAIQKLAPTFILTAVALTVFGGAMMIFAGVVALLGSMSIGTLAKGIISMAIGLTALGTIAAILGLASPLILAFGVALGVVGVAVGIAAAGLFLLATAFTAFGASLPIVISMFVGLIPAIIKSIGEGIIQLVTVIGESASTIAASVTQVVLAVLASLTEIIPAIVEFVLTVIQNVLVSLNTHLPEILTLIVDFLINVLTTISQKIPEFVQTGIELMINFINGLADGIRNNTAAAIEAFDNLISAIVEALGMWFTHFVEKGGELVTNIAEGMGIHADSPVQAIGEIIQSILDRIGEGVSSAVQAGIDFVQGLAEGIAKGASSAWDAAKDLAGGALKAVKEKFDSNSPSKEEEKEGKNFDDGLANGIKKYADNPEQAAKDMAASAGEAVNTVLAEGVEGAGKAAEEFAKRYGLELTPAVEENTDAVGTNTDVVGKNTSAINANSNAIDKNAGSTKKASKAMEDSIEAETKSFDIMSFGADVVKAVHERFGAAYEAIGDTSSLEASKSAVEALAIATYEASKKAEEGTESSKKSSKEAKNEIEEIKKSFLSLKQTLSQKVSGQMDIFKEFSRETKTSAADMLKNMRSQVQGVSDWSNAIQELAARGIDQGLLKKLAELGPQGYDYVNAFVQMTGQELQEANSLYATSLAIPDQVSTDILASYAYAGSVASGNFMQGMQENSAALSVEASAVAENIKTAFDAGAAKFTESGALADQSTGQGITDNEPVVETASAEMVAQVVDASNKIAADNGGTVGYNLILGIAKGITDNISIAENAAAQAMAHLNANGVETPQEIQSPSKVWAEYGRFLDLGMVQGLTDYAHLVAAAGEGVSQDTMLAMQNALSRVSIDDLSEDVQPVITPILDLTNVQNGVGTINGLFSNQTYGVNAIATVSQPSMASQNMSMMMDAINRLATPEPVGTTIGDINVVVNAEGITDPNEFANVVAQQIYNEILSREAILF